MPSIIKTLTTISVWILFIHGIVAIIWGGADMLIISDGWRLTRMAALSCAIGTANLLMAVVAAKLRQTMD